MKKIYYPFIFLYFSFFYLSAQSNLCTSQVIVKLKKEAALSSDSYLTGIPEIDFIHTKFQAEKITRHVTGKRQPHSFYVVRFPDATNVDQVIAEYYLTGEIEYAEPDNIGSGHGVQATIPNDTYYSRQWGLKNDGSFSLSPATAGADIEMESAWNIEQGDSNIVVGVVDTGTKMDHPDFAGRIWYNYLEIPNNGFDDDSNGYIDDIKGWDFANDDNDPRDDFGHGTNVAGILGAKANNTFGYAGVDWHCKIMVLKGLDDTNYGYYSWWSDAIYYAVDNGAKVINLSLGGVSVSTTLQAAANYALNNNVVLVVSTGNANSNTVQYPSGYPGVIAVGSTNANDTRSKPFFWDVSSGSNFGSHISVVAPGNYVYGLSHQSNSNFSSYWGGTSQAAPHVAGLATLLLSQNPSRTPAQIKSIIETTAEDQVGSVSEDLPGWDQYFGFGRINAFQALSLPANIDLTEDQNLEFSVFPNPGHQNFTASFPESTNEVRIFNSLGKMIQKIEVNQQLSQNFQLSESGIYFIQVISEVETSTRKLQVFNP